MDNSNTHVIAVPVSDHLWDDYTGDIDYQLDYLSNQYRYEGGEA